MCDKLCGTGGNKIAWTANGIGELHTFGDASIQGVGAAIYAVVKQPSGTTQQLVKAQTETG